MCTHEHLTARGRFILLFTNKHFETHPIFNQIQETADTKMATVVTFFSCHFMLLFLVMSERNIVPLPHHIHLTGKLTFHINDLHTNFIKCNTLLKIRQWFPTFRWYKIRFLVSCQYFTETQSPEPEDCCMLLKSSVSVVSGAGVSVEAALNFNLLPTVWLK